MEDLRTFYLRQLQGRLFDITAELTRLRCQSSVAPPAWRPAANVFLCADRIMVCVELAGVDRSEIGLKVEPFRVILEGRRVPLEPREVEAAPLQVLMMEIDHGPFRREIVLPAEVQPERARAEQREGVLWVQLPLAPSA